MTDPQTRGYIDGVNRELGAAALRVHEAEDLPAEKQEALVADLIDKLLKAEHLTTDQAEEAFYEEGSREFGTFVDLFHGEMCTRVFFDGRVEHHLLNA